MIRAFIAARVAATPELHRLLNRMSDLGRAVRPVAAENLHLTLRFLGDVEPSETPAIAAAMRSAAEGVQRFEVRLAGVGAFPRPERPSVIWVGMHGAEPFGRIVQALAPRLGAIGLSEPDKPWQAHLTVARVKAKPGNELSELLSRFANTDFGVQSIGAVQLVESLLGPSGPTYVDLDQVQLGAEEQ